MGILSSIDIDFWRSLFDSPLKVIVNSLDILIVAFLIYATAKSGKVPEGAIGQADAMTNIQVNGDFIFDASQIILLVGIIAFAFATIQIIRAVHNNRR